MNPDSRRDLDVFCTAYVNRGGMGNRAVEEPGSVLYGTVEDCLGRGTGAGEARAHVYLVLERAGVDPAEAERTADHVHDVFHIISEFREVEAAGTARLERARQQPLLAVCDPAVDARWFTKAIHKKYDKQPSGKPKYEAWLHATREELEEGGLNESWLGYGAFPYLNREDGPALILWSERYDGPFEEYWFKHGEQHREDGPAVITYDATGTVVEEKYFRNGVQVRKPQLND